ncbi:monovalent cation/H+ antiporter complex subunit F [Aquipuribacter sp. MA13-6]|uniref:monovalent cation/H+ antiporter complex subunit F n=1 Tax=unclassified Aquipuribacter TaxID=2635084 RepID=UPI003EEE8507
MGVVVPVVATMLAVAGLLAVARLLRGPTTLDRVVATDMLLAILLCSLAALAAARTDVTITPVILIGTLLGFVGSVAVARMIARRDP